jgi:gas vesicle protein
MNSGKIVLGILGGVAVGAIAGILFAPAKGKDTRKKILKNSKNYVDNFKDKIHDLQNEVTDKYNGYFDDAKDKVAKAEKVVAENLK